MVNSADRANLKKFEDVVLKNEEVGIALKLFRCIKVDLARDKIAKSMYGDKVPRFIAYDTKGKIIDEVYIAGYRSKTGPLMNLLLKASRGHGKLPLKTFISKYRSFLNELDKMENKKSTLAKKKARLLGTDKKPLAAARPGGPGATAAQTWRDSPQAPEKEAEQAGSSQGQEGGERRAGPGKTDHRIEKARGEAAGRREGLQQQASHQGRRRESQARSGRRLRQQISLARAVARVCLKIPELF